MVVLGGRMQHYANVIDYFEDAAERSVTDRVVISLSDNRPILFDQLPKPQGKLALDGRREHAWAVVTPFLHFFAMTNARASLGMHVDRETVRI